MTLCEYCERNAPGPLNEVIVADEKLWVCDGCMFAIIDEREEQRS